MAQVRYQKANQDHRELVEEIYKVVVHQFHLGDVEDPDLYAADPLYQWQISEPGKFVMENAVDQPTWHRQHDFKSLGWRYVIVAELEKKKLAEFYLRWGKQNGSN